MLCTNVSAALAMSFKCVCVCIHVRVHIPSMNLVSRWRQVYSDQYPACAHSVALSSQSYLHPYLHILPSPHTGYKKTDFHKEIDMMKLVAKGSHTHAVSFVGCVTIQEPLCLITEFVRHGDLLAYLYNIRRMVR